MIWPKVPDAQMVPVASSFEIVVAQHYRQRNEAHGDNRRTNDAGGGSEQRANEHHRNAKPARNWAEKLRHGDEQILGDFGPLQHDAHEHEQGESQSACRAQRPSTDS